MIGALEEGARGNERKRMLEAEIGSITAEQARTIEALCREILEKCPGAGINAEKFDTNPPQIYQEAMTVLDVIEREGAQGVDAWIGRWTRGASNVLCTEIKVSSNSGGDPVRLFLTDRDLEALGIV